MQPFGRSLEPWYSISLVTTVNTAVLHVLTLI